MIFRESDPPIYYEENTVMRMVLWNNVYFQNKWPFFKYFVCVFEYLLQAQEHKGPFPRCFTLIHRYLS